MLRAEYQPAGRGTTEPPLADPVRWRAGAGSPVWSAARGQRTGASIPWLQKMDASFNARFAVPNGTDGYLQLIYPPTGDSADLGTGFDPSPHAAADPLAALRDVPSGLKELPARTRRLLDECVAAGKLPAQVTASAGFRRDGRPESQDWEAVANAFRDHLAAGGFEYTLKLRRQDRQSDPIEDFLYRTKAGNCERFAAGLVLMCRAVGVPARYVLGFKGHEPAGDGRYLVRQDHAHAWAEVLVPRGTGAATRWHWLSLDPTPDGGGEAGPADLLSSAAQGGKSFFSEFIVGYNADRRRQAAAEVVGAVTGPPFLLGLGGVFAAVGLAGVVWQVVTSLRRRAARRPAAVAWYARLVDVLTWAGHPLPPGATPAEYARAVTAKLASRPETADVAEVPGRLTAMFYAERFGSHPPTANEAAHIDTELARLAHTLAVG